MDLSEIVLKVISLAALCAWPMPAGSLATYLLAACLLAARPLFPAASHAKVSPTVRVVLSPWHATAE